MDTEENLATFAGRLATFERPHHFAKRRASSAKKKAQTTVSWPHQTPTPQDLARAGFYYRPSSASPDSVTCFLCDKVLDGWEAGDNPATEHLSHVPDCGFAINVCIEQRSQDMDRAEEDPHSRKMMESRRATFQDAWPHEGRKGWKCKTSKMVEAGWCYTPLPEADDCVHCFYCGVSLDGWEPKDDPWDEHRKRAPDCHFFSLIEESKALKQHAKKGRGRQSRASKASRLSTQSNMTITYDGPTMLESDTESAEEGDTMMTTASTASRPKRVAKKTAKKAAPKKTQRTLKRDEPVPTEPVVEAMADEEKPSIDMEPQASITSPAEAKSLPPPAKSRSKRQPKRTASQSVDMESSVLEVQPPTRKVSRTTKTKKQSEIMDEASQLHIEVEAVAQRLADASGTPRGKKRTGDGLEKVDSSVVVHEIAPEPAISNSKARPAKRARQTKKATGQAEDETELEPSTDADAVQTETIPVRDSEKAKGKANARKGRVVSKQQISTPIAEPDVQPPANISPPADQPLMTELEPIDQVAPPSPLPDPKGPSPTMSPQSSDAENVPPSSRPSLSASQQAPQPIRIPLATTPQQSPSKRNILPAVSTLHPWTAVDLESIFLASPTSRANKKNVSLDTALERLTSPEKRMSIEEWILANAENAEARLRADCEGLIWKFEGEGNRALRSLEGLETAA